MHRPERPGGAVGVAELPGAAEGLLGELLGPGLALAPERLGLGQERQADGAKGAALHLLEAERHGQHPRRRLLGAAGADQRLALEQEAHQVEVGLSHPLGDVAHLLGARQRGLGGAGQGLQAAEVQERPVALVVLGLGQGLKERPAALDLAGPDQRRPQVELGPGPHPLVHALEHRLQHPGGVLGQAHAPVEVGEVKGGAGLERIGGLHLGQHRPGLVQPPLVGEVAGVAHGGAPKAPEGLLALFFQPGLKGGDGAFKALGELVVERPHPVEVAVGDLPVLEQVAVHVEPELGALGLQLGVVGGVLDRLQGLGEVGHHPAQLLQAAPAGTGGEVDQELGPRAFGEVRRQGPEQVDF